MASEEGDNFTCVRLSSLCYILHLSSDKNCRIKFEIYCFTGPVSVFLFGQVLSHKRGLSLYSRKGCVTLGQIDID